MNTTPDPAPQSPPPPTGGFFAWIRGLGITRGSDRWFAGVAGGIAAKAGIDPLIVRGIFVVLALLGGPGVLLYLAGWLLLPDFTGRIRLEDLFRGRAEGWTIVAVVAVALMAIPALLNLFTPSAFGWAIAPWGVFGLPGWLSGTITWIVWIAIIVFASIWISRTMRARGAEHLAREQAAKQQAGYSHSGNAENAAEAPGASAAPAGSGSVPSDAPPTTEQPDTAEATANSAQQQWTADSAGRGSAWTAGSSAPFGEQARNWGDDFGKKADAWGQDFGKKADAWGQDLGKRADDWSARYAEQHEARKLGAAHITITLALALLAGGITALWANSIGGVMAIPGSTAVAALVAALAVLAVSLIIAGIRGRNTGWIGFLSACGVVTLIFTSILPWGTQFQPFGTMDLDGTASPGAVLIAGSTRLDLSHLDDAKDTRSASDKKDEFVIWQLAGNSTVTLPQDRPTSVDVRVLAGNITEQQGDTKLNAAGPFLGKTITANFNSNGGSSAPVMKVTVYLLAGNVKVVDPSGTTVSKIEPTVPRATEKPSQRTSEKIEQLEDKLATVEWQLDEPGLSSTNRNRLEAERTQLKQDIKDLELEAAQ
ncbi:PspC domain-containing protein [Leucobacter viscericola]|uniref:PspC domain-containing protein n=1 Tax=Leucobacter viscericola TaxID=2714935 RepID=A0A6G7XHP0_9MICO|nr:PspC domain-containing protein [Leucobacter viscericola]QIK63996.1 PspC domain-containing protein [Leucobacter viscericola]